MMVLIKMNKDNKVVMNKMFITKKKINVYYD